MKELSDMTLEELWQLFPIQLVPHDPRWKAWYEAARQELRARLPREVRIHHIGSTAVDGIWAKPIVDILVEADPGEHPAIHQALLASGWTCMCEELARRDYNLGYTGGGFAEKVFHLHLRAAGDCDELYFRDCLRAHPDVAREYEALKLSLWKRYEHDRDGYTAAKGDFIRRWTQDAKREAVTFRFARREDAALLLWFIRRLAAYEKMSGEVVATEELLQEWVFDKQKAEALFAVVDGKEIGFALFFHNFSTFLGRAGVYLEDLYVLPEYRGRGYGKAILRELAGIAVRRGCGRLEWWCLNWNRPSIDFYRALDAEPMEDWTVYRLSGATLHKLAEE